MWPERNQGTIPLLEAASAVVVGAAQWFPWAVQIEGWSEKTMGHERRQIRWCLKTTLPLSANNPEFKAQTETGTKELTVDPWAG